MSSVPLSAIAEINPPSPVSPAEDEPVSFLPMAAVANDGGGFRPEARSYGEVSKGYTPFASGDVLLAKITPCFENGKVAYIDRLPHRVGYGSTEFHVLRPHDDLDGRYLFHLLRSPRFRLDGEARMTGSAGQQRVPAQFLRDYELPRPLLSEQKRIAAILDKADAIRAKRRAALAEADALLRATFLDLFGTNSQCMERWPVAPLADLLSFLTSGSRGWARYYATEGAAFIRIENVRRGHLDLSELTLVSPPKTAEAKRTRVRPGDVLLSITADLGRCGVVPSGIGEAYVNQHLAILRPSGVDPTFLCAFLTTPAGQIQFSRLNRSAVKAGLNFDDIRSVRVPLPPEGEQRRYAGLDAQIAAMKHRLSGALADADALYASLVQRAFRGEL